jgi:peptidoglycan/LPS O-acetylase OafA/YrhL
LEDPRKANAEDPRPLDWVARTREYLAFRRLPGQLPVLDGLRGIAVILVLLRHASHLVWDRSEPLVPILGFDAGILMLNGWIGVDLFFVLSGFLITHHILRLRERHDGQWPWKRYLAKRGLRIIPAYYAVLFLAVLGAFPYYEISDQVLGLRIGYHLLFLQDYLPANIVVSFWSMGVEEKFYLIAPFLVLASAMRPKLRERIAGPMVIVLAGVALRVFTMQDRPDVVEYETFFRTFRSPFHLTLDPILVGVVLAFIYRERERLPRLTAPSSARLVFWLGASGFVALVASHDMMGQISWWDMTLRRHHLRAPLRRRSEQALRLGLPALLRSDLVLPLPGAPAPDSARQGSDAPERACAAELSALLRDLHPALDPGRPASALLRGETLPEPQGSHSLSATGSPGLPLRSIPWGRALSVGAYGSGSLPPAASHCFTTASPSRGL